MPMLDIDEFRSRYEADGLDGCWTWRHTRQNGYGTWNKRGQQHYAHRVAYTLEFGRIPDGLVIDHLCRNRACVNPLHLEAVTQGENTRRGMRATATHCQRGHAFDEENTLHVSVYGVVIHRLCRECRNWRERQRRLRLKGDSGADS